MFHELGIAAMYSAVSSHLTHLAFPAWTSPHIAGLRTLVGGDYYDFLYKSGSDLWFTVGDVSGKGIAAAVLMASLQVPLYEPAQQSTQLRHRHCVRLKSNCMFVIGPGAV